MYQQQAEINSTISKQNSGTKYFHFPSGWSISLLPKFVNEFNKDFMNHMKQHQQNILQDCLDQRMVLSR